MGTEIDREMAPEGPLGTGGAAQWIARMPDAVRDHLLVYTETYTGRWFEWFANRSRPGAFSADDILAVAALSVDVPTEAAATLLTDTGGRFASLLERAHDYAAKEGAPAGLAQMDLTGAFATTLSELYTAVREVPGLGKVSASKLLAAKFPAHVPIRDARVERLLGLSTSREWWAPMQGLLNDAGVADALAAVELPDDRHEVTVLRRLDIVLWREAERRGLG